MDKLDKSNALEVNCVRDEYIHVSKQPCESCNRKNAYKLCTQHLIQSEDRSYDILDTECQYCGYKKHFTFDITECFQNPEKQLSAMLKDLDKHDELDWDSET
ncbi:MAG: hypothetical protein WED07_03195 [Candidatus Freyarchaeum deiterrae]